MTLSLSGTPGDAIVYYYNRCSGEAITGTLIVGGSPAEINDCVVSGSVKTRNTVGSPTTSLVYGDACT